jgi:AMIN domain
VEDIQPNLAFRPPRFCRSLRRSLHEFLHKQKCSAIWPGMFTLGILALAVAPLHSQAPAASVAKPAGKSASSSKVAAIKSFRIVQEKDGQAVEILSTRPLVPSIQAVSDPDRLVIDLPNARLDTQQKKISVQADQIGAIRADQFQQNPPIARVVVDLLAPRAYTWDAAGNRLVVHLGKNPGQASTSPFQAPNLSLAPAPRPVVAAVRSASPVALAEIEKGVGSTISAGPDTTILNLSRGGEVHVCPGTTVSVTPSQNRHNVMFSMNTGALEAHFALDASSDSVMTPDFRILLVGPGEFHYAISADNQGNTCVRALPGNTASAIVSELIGDRTYQVKATDQLVFHSGQLDRVDMAVPLECGCPPVRDAQLQAASAPPMQSQNQAQAKDLPSVDAGPASVPDTAHANAVPSNIPPGPLEASLAPNDLHVQVTDSFVFHATGPPPLPMADEHALPVDSRARTAPALAAPLPPSSATSPIPRTDTAGDNRVPARGFFRRIGGFFAALFH